MKTYKLSALVFLGFIAGCSPQGELPNSIEPISSGNQPTSQWTQYNISKVAVGGLLQPNVVAEQAADLIHIGFMESEGTETNIRALTWSQTLQAQVGNTQTVQTVDNSATLAAALTTQDTLKLSYQGGQNRQCQEDEQSDIMMSQFDGQWHEQTAAIGFVARNPTFSDGLAGGQVAMVTDDFGATHIVYQFFYEGCDANSFAYPDIKYVSIAEGDTSVQNEILVDGNTYNDVGIQLTSLAAGEFSDIVMTSYNSPVVFYSAENSNADQRGLKVATLDNSEWSNLWIEDDCTVEGISAAIAPDGTLGVSYYTTQCGSETFQPRLNFAEYNNNQWHTEVLNTRHRSGRYPSLAFDKLSSPIIVSQEKDTHGGFALDNLLVSLKTDGTWQYEQLAEGMGFGAYNSLWFDENNHAAILSYSTKLKIMSLFIQ